MGSVLRVRHRHHAGQQRITQAQHPAPTTDDYLAQLAQGYSADDRRQLADVRRDELGTACNGCGFGGA